MGRGKKIGFGIGIVFAILIILGAIGNYASSRNQPPQPLSSTSVPATTSKPTNTIETKESFPQQPSQTNPQPNNSNNVDVSDIVKGCTKPFPSPNKFNVENYVDSNCLINNAKTVQYCQAYTKVLIMKLEIIDLSGYTSTKSLYFSSLVDCVTKLALQDHQVEDCYTLSDSTQCTIQYVKKFNEPKACQNTTNPQTCFEQVSITLGAATCKLIQDENGVLNCIQNYFNSNYLESILYGIGKQCTSQNKSLGYVSYASCILQDLNLKGISPQELLTWTHDSKIIACNVLDTLKSMDNKTANDYCVGIIGAYAKDLSICDNAGSARAECYATIADTENIVNLSTCDRLNSGVSFCYMHVAYRLNDISICDKAGDNKQNCINLVNSKNKQ